uniref:Uncharacterized protein n=1 Tax=Arundo donax TaxID=35708 RepID=A0A0A9FC57_ARUDO
MLLRIRAPRGAGGRCRWAWMRTSSSR